MIPLHLKNRLGGLKIMAYKRVTYEEFDINDLDKNKDFYKVRFNKGGRKIKAKYLNLCCGFDIETSTIGNHSYMYCWQVCLDNISIVGRKWEQFFELQDKLLKYYNIDVKKKEKILFWVANLSYEFQFIRKRVDIERIFAKESREPISVSLKNGIEFQDALAISGGSLEGLAKDFTKTQKKKVTLPDGTVISDLDYTKIRNSMTPLTDEELDYIYSDVEILSEFARYMFDKYASEEYMPITKTSILRTDVKERAYKMIEEGRFKRFSKRSHLENYIRSLYPKTEKEYNAEMFFLFKGAVTHGNVASMGRVLEDLEAFDLTSSYPFVLLTEKYPVTPFQRVDIKRFEELKNFDEYAYKMLVKFKNFEATTDHTIESKHKFVNFYKNGKPLRGKDCPKHIDDNGRIMFAEEAVLYINDVDLEILQDFYKWDSYEIGFCDEAKKGYLPAYLIEPMIENYIEKDKLKAAGLDGTPEYAEKKAYVNSIFGMCCTRLVDEDITYVNGEWGHDVIRNHRGEVKSYDEKIKGSVLSPYWGIYCTSYAKRNLCKYLLFPMHKDCHYYDTDSLKISNIDRNMWVIDEYNKMCDNKVKNACSYYGFDVDSIIGLGQFDHEGHVYRFKTLGAKRYVMDFEKKGKKRAFVNVIAGLGKGKVKAYCDEKGYDYFDFFKDGMEIPEDFTNKLRCDYDGDRPHCEEVEDYLGNKEVMEELSSVALLPVGFTMNMTRDFINIINDFYKRWERGIAC